MKEQIQLPNENTCDCHLTLNGLYYCIVHIDTHVFIMLTFISINREKEICLPNKEYISGTDGESINMVTKSIVYMLITTELEAYLLSKCSDLSGLALQSNSSNSLCLYRADNWVTLYFRQLLSSTRRLERELYMVHKSLEEHSQDKDEWVIVIMTRVLHISFQECKKNHDDSKYPWYTVDS